jgi:hypothetical protein
VARQRTRLHYKKLVDNIIGWLNSDIDDWKDNEITNDPYIAQRNAVADNSRDLKEKIDLYLEGVDEF